MEVTQCGIQLNDITKFQDRLNFTSLKKARNSFGLQLLADNSYSFYYWVQLSNTVETPNKGTPNKTIFLYLNQNNQDGK